MQLEFREALPIYQQITESLKQQILRGVYGPGDPLPSVRELAGQLAINPNTIQRAYHELEAAGYTESVPGKGSFVRSAAAAAGSSVEKAKKEFRRQAVMLLAQGVSTEELIAIIRETGEGNHAGNESGR